MVTLLEGGTPLVPAETLSDRLGVQVFLKVEGANPTGSFKDRGMTVAVTHALAAGAKAVICASTGNTSASAAAYAARAGITSAVLVPQGKIAAGKLAQAVAYGARILQIEGNFDDCLELARKTAASHEEIALVNSVNPVRIEGQKTAAFEICDTLGRAPDIHYLPVGNAGNITAYWKGYREYYADGVVDSLPRMFGFQAAGSAPLVLGHPVSAPGHHRHRHPDRRARVLDRCHRRPRLVTRVDRLRHRRADPARLQVAGLDRGRVRRTGVRRLGGRTAGHRRRRPVAGRDRWWSAPSPATGSRTRTPR